MQGNVAKDKIKNLIARIPLDNNRFQCITETYSEIFFIYFSRFLSFGHTLYIQEKNYSSVITFLVEEVVES